MPHSTPPATIPTPRLAFPALMLGNIFLAFGPALVRLTDVGPTAAAFWRLSIALPFLLLLARREGMRMGSIGRLWPMLVLGGLLFAADLAAWHAGIVRTKIANATVFGNISALLLPLWGILILRQTPGLWQKIAIALAAIGTVVMMGGGYQASPLYMQGDLLCLLAGIFYTGYVLALQRARQTMGSWSVLTSATAIATLPVLGFAMLLGEAILPTDWTWIILLALSSQVMGQGLIVYAIGWFWPLILGLSLLVQPMVGALIGWLLFGETLTLSDVAGTVAIAVALILVRLPTRP